MVGPTSARADPAKTVTRTSSIDSAISAISSKPRLNKASVDSAVGSTDIANLIKTAGSPEAVIQYLLKEKQSQSQQNSQLWRLVDKQRAMILGLNKDLERALKDKEKYRKKLKEVLEGVEGASGPSVPLPTTPGADPNGLDAAPSSPKQRVVVEIPLSPMSVDPGSQKDSPIDVPLAPYPITPPANQPIIRSSRSAVREILDPAHTMPKPSEHAFDHYDHEAQEQEAEAAEKRAEEAKDLHIDMNLPPSRSAPREPPRMPPPQPPVGLPDRSPKPDEGASKFPPPPAPPPRKPPPAPLHLNNSRPRPAVAPEEDPDTDTDYDHILEVDELKPDESRGRRRTREEDERDREILARKEAEARSLSKKSKKSSSRKATEKEEAPFKPPRSSLRESLHLLLAS
ncbi:Rho GTPase activating protein [Collariella sp. IMI 366227]|nr:Rho GTPase activating protein [Collariella sp. IMI 366227]